MPEKEALEESSDFIDLPDRFINPILSKLHLHGDATDDDFQQEIVNVIAEEAAGLRLTLMQKRELAKRLFNRMRRLDILQPMMDNPEVTEIMVNGPDHIFFEKGGRLYASELRFRSESELEIMITNFFSRANRPLNETHPIGDLRLPDGSRANAILPPIAPDGPIFTIRKFTGIRPDMNTMLRQGTLTPEMAAYLKEAVINRKTIFLCGGTGSGKTTFLNMLSAFIPREERVVTIEDSAELSLQGLENLVRLEARLAGPDGTGAIEISTLIRTALRMRPNRIIVGEVRGRESADLLNALHTGHPGSLCTGHANSCREMLSRLAAMAMAGSSLPYDAIIQQITLGIDILLFLERDQNGHRKVIEIMELTGYENHQFELKCIYKYQEKNDATAKETGTIFG